MAKPARWLLWHQIQLRVKGYLVFKLSHRLWTTLRKIGSNIIEGKRYFSFSVLMCLCSQNGSLTIGGTYILVRHFPIWSLSIGHDLPHDNPIAPCIACRGEFSVGNSFWGCPPYRYFPTLENKLKIYQMAHKCIKKQNGVPIKYLTLERPKYCMIVLAF